MSSKVADGVAARSLATLQLANFCVFEPSPFVLVRISNIAYITCRSNCDDDLIPSQGPSRRFGSF